MPGSFSRLSSVASIARSRETAWTRSLYRRSQKVRDRSASSRSRATSDGVMKRALKPSKCASVTPRASAQPFQT